MECGCVVVEAQGAVGVFDDERRGQERLQMRLAGDGAGAGTASAVRSGKSLVQVEVHHVHAEVAGARLGDEGVHVGSVHVEQAALAMEDLGDLRDLLVEDAEGVGVGEHEARDIFVHLGFEGGEIDHAAARCWAGFRPGSRPWRRWRDWCRARSRGSEFFCAGCPAIRDRRG